MVGKLKCLKYLTVLSEWFKKNACFKHNSCKGY